MIVEFVPSDVGRVVIETISPVAVAISARGITAPQTGRVEVPALAFESDAAEKPDFVGTMRDGFAYLFGEERIARLVVYERSSLRLFEGPDGKRTYAARLGFVAYLKPEQPR
ncbi:MAG TPA: hypothetical protein VGH28_10480 [Polyangiaceae bacterium]|jgi:hypothetical protein